MRRFQIVDGIEDRFSWDEWQKTQEREREAEAARRYIPPRYLQPDFLKQRRLWKVFSVRGCSIWEEFQDLDGRHISREVARCRSNTAATQICAAMTFIHCEELAALETGEDASFGSWRRRGQWRR